MDLRIYRTFPVLLAAALAGAQGCLESQAPSSSSNSLGGQGGGGRSAGGSGHGTTTGSAGSGSYCGDGLVDPGEDCDGDALAGMTCAAVGYDDGALSCSDDCHFDASSCCYNECPGPPGTHECASNDSVRACGQYDADACLEWGPIQQCPAACDQGECTCAGDADCVLPQDPCHESQGSCAGAKCTYPVKVDGTPCDDGNQCTQLDTCQNGACVGDDPIVCAAQDPCHVTGVCNPATGRCSTPNVANATPCDDGNACTQTDACQAGTCKGTNPLLCAAQDPCHVKGTCDPQTGLCPSPPAANGTACDDGDACTLGDACQGGACIAGNPVVCTALDPCHLPGTCDPTTGKCSNPNAADGASCNDGSACTKTDVCQGGVCVGTDPIVCAAQDGCHLAGVCNPATGQCSNPNAVNGTTCNDGNACSLNDTCQNGACVAGSQVVCNSPPNTQCYSPAGSCSGGACSYAPKPYGTPCNDGNACSLNDVCDGNGSCAGSALMCNSPPTQCHNPAGACAGGACSYAFKPSGSPCNDGDPCTQGDACNGGGTCAGAAIQCNSPPDYQCYYPSGVCGGGACSYTPRPYGTSCNDGNACTQGDVCNGGGTCSGSAVQCNNPPGECWSASGFCSGGSCQYAQKSAGSVCSGGVCQSGACVACLNGQTQSASCFVGGMCPSGTQSRTCSGGQWGPYGQCAAPTSQRYCGDGVKACGAVLCIQIQSGCSNSTVTAIISKADNSTFLYNTDLTLFAPGTGQSKQYGCFSTAGQYSFNLQLNPAQFGLNALGGALAVDAQVFSPCSGGGSYISGYGYVYKCSN